MSQVFENAEEDDRGGGNMNTPRVNMAVSSYMAAVQWTVTIALYYVGSTEVWNAFSCIGLKHSERNDRKQPATYTGKVSNIMCFIYRLRYDKTVHNITKTGG